MWSWRAGRALLLERMAAVARRLGQQVGFSHDTGAFVCNHVFFTASHVLATEFSGSRCGFVHLPFIAGSGEALTRAVALVRVDGRQCGMVVRHGADTASPVG